MLTNRERYRKALQGFIEYEWQEYPRYIDLMERMTFDELMDKLSQERGNRYYADKRLEWITRVVNAVDKVYAEAPEDVKQLARVKYWSEDKTNWQTIAERLGISMQKAVRMNKAMIIKTADIMGFWWDR